MRAHIFLSAITGILFALIEYGILQLLGVPEPHRFSVAGASLFSLILFFFLIIHEKVTERKYTEFEKNIRSPVFYKINGNFTLPGGSVRNGNIYFCESGIVCVSLDGKPHTVDEIPVEDIEKYRFDDIHIHIFTRDGRVFLITLPDVPAVRKALQEKDWI